MAIHQISRLAQPLRKSRVKRIAFFLSPAPPLNITPGTFFIQSPAPPPPTAAGAAHRDKTCLPVYSHIYIRARVIVPYYVVRFSRARSRTYAGSRWRAFYLESSCAPIDPEYFCLSHPAALAVYILFWSGQLIKFRICARARVTTARLLNIIYISPVHVYIPGRRDCCAGSIIFYFCSPFSPSIYADALVKREWVGERAPTLSCIVFNDVRELLFRSLLWPRQYYRTAYILWTGSRVLWKFYSILPARARSVPCHTHLVAFTFSRE